MIVQLLLWNKGSEKTSFVYSSRFGAGLNTVGGDFCHVLGTPQLRNGAGHCLVFFSAIFFLTHRSIFYLPKNVISLIPLKGTLHIKLACKDPTILVGEGRIRKKIIKQNRMADNNWQLRRFQTTCKLKFIFCFIESRL